tara:strand:- start:393 stop:536 length:144 start_codon:yes stop_codon:yes gene_type:complete
VEIILTIWGIGIIYCIYDAIFFSELDPESKKELKERDNERKNNNLYE